MKQEMINLYKTTKTWYNQCYQELLKAQKQLQTARTPEEAADMAYALNELHKWCDDMRKEAKRAKEIADRVACLLWVQRDNGDNIKTDHCTATPIIKMQPKVPKLSSDPEAYYALMDYLGIPRTTSDQELVRVHWPSMVEYLTLLAEEGRPMPKGIDPNGSRPEYRLMIRSKRAVDDIGE